MNSSAQGPAVRRLLMVCYMFPPAAGTAAPAVQRAMKLIRALKGSPWQPMVLTVDSDGLESYIDRDEQYAADLISETTIIRSKRIRSVERLMSRLKHWLRRGRPAAAVQPSAAFAGPKTDSVPVKISTLRRAKNSMSALLQMPDPHVGWLWWAVFDGARAIRRHHVSVIYATGFPWSGLLVGALLKVITRRPLVLDFRDPWVTNPYRAHFHPLRRRFETALEAWVVRRGDVVVANTRTLEEEFRRRYPRGRFVAIYNSIDSTLLTGVPRATPGPSDTSGPVRLAHAGFLYGPRDPALLLKAMALRRQRARAVEVDLVLELIGRIVLSYSLERLVSELGLNGSVEVRGSVDHARCQEMLQASSALLVLQPGTKTQIPSKIFEYMMHRKPILAIAERDSETYRMAADELHAFVAEAGDVNDIADALDRLVQAVRSGRGADSVQWDRVVALYGERASAVAWQQTLDSALGGVSASSRLGSSAEKPPRGTSQQAKRADTS